ncbi:sigma-54 dependent transcriptional regulator [Undibacterium sp.]|jgi:two-component system response regulator HydG|uniref:sigma-54 dependent transcriptional regulator n=1 Tax=Undibacterium sp. TaxID=1914977 RepID=UPI002B8003C7|nr:sigma-54 dependent transcriptional regulator [Undibacterium sp.]HTD05091.1 sigma-54 dependent transcriptional regulator [Undibacterium sp.]
MIKRKILCLRLQKNSASFEQHLQDGEWEIHYAAEILAAERMMRDEPYLACLLAMDNIELIQYEILTQLLNAHPECEWIGVFHPDSLLSWKCHELILGYLFDYHTQPIDSQRLSQTVGHAYGRAMMRQQSKKRFANNKDMAMVGESPSIKALFKHIKQIASSEATVLIGGENGSGKELTALAIHRCSSRRNGPFVPVSCGSIPSQLIQSELFGYQRGAFTGAAVQKAGFIESADRGTIFLDEIADLPLDLQTNLLRFLQEKTITRIGSATSTPVNARVIAASNINLQEAVDAGKFRQDLFYRLNVLPIVVPPLRERKEDIELLANHFLEVFGKERKTRLNGFTAEAVQAMLSHNWPGNVRELINRIRRAIVTTDGRLISAQDLNLESQALLKSDDLANARISAEREAIFNCLIRTGRNKTRAAQDLGVSRMTLYRLMEKHGINGDLQYISSKPAANNESARHNDNGIRFSSAIKSPKPS